MYFIMFPLIFRRGFSKLFRKLIRRSANSEINYIFLDPFGIRPLQKLIQIRLEPFGFDPQEINSALAERVDLQIPFRV